MSQVYKERKVQITEFNLFTFEQS